MDTFGDDCPENWDIIAVMVNNALYSLRVSGTSPEGLRACSAAMLAEFKQSGKICGIEAEYR